MTALTMGTPDALHPPKDAAKILSLSTSWLAKARLSGAGPQYVKIGRSVRYPDWALALRRAGKSVLFIHHGGKSGQQRGSSRKEDVLDSVLALRRPPDYSPDQGARFEIHFEKTRGFHGEDAKPFEAHLVDGCWITSKVKSGDDDATLLALRKQGLSIRDIGDRTGVPRSTVSRRLGGGDE